MNPVSALVAPELISRRILLIRNHKVMLDTDLAELYGVETRALNQAVRRNIERFPADFMFQLTKEEKREVITNCDHLARLKFSPKLPRVFTEHGAIMAATVLNSPPAVAMSVYVVRAFIRMREQLPRLRCRKPEIAEHIAVGQGSMAGAGIGLHRIRSLITAL